MSAYAPKYKKTVGKGLTPVQKKQVKKIVSSEIETKHFYDGVAPFAVSNAGVISQLSLVPQGVQVAQRIGDSINLQKLTLNFDCIASQATLGNWLAGDAYNNLRMIVFRWYENTVSTFPSVSDVLNTTTAAYTYLSPLNMDRIEAGIVHIVHDQTYILENTPYWNGTTTLFASGQSSIHNTMNKQLYGRKLGKKKIFFNNNATTATNHLYLLCISDSSATPHPYAQYSFDLNYSDA